MADIMVLLAKFRVFITALGNSATALAVKCQQIVNFCGLDSQNQVIFWWWLDTDSPIKANPIDIPTIIFFPDYNDRHPSVTLINVKEHVYSMRVLLLFFIFVSLHDSVGRMTKSILSLLNISIYTQVLARYIYIYSCWHYNNIIIKDIKHDMHALFSNHFLRMWHHCSCRSGQIKAFCCPFSMRHTWMCSILLSLQHLHIYLFIVLAHLYSVRASSCLIAYSILQHRFEFPKIATKSI